MSSMNGTVERFEITAPVAVESKRKSSKAKKAPTTGRSRKTAVKADDHLKQYAMGGVIGMAVLSAFLNGYSHAQHAPSPALGWLIGFAIPGVILVLGKVAGILWRRKVSASKGILAGAYGWMASITAISGGGLLLLSIWHCAEALAALTGSPILLTAPMAIAIDAGFVCCELALLAD